MYLTLLTILLDQNCLFYSFLPFLKVIFFSLNFYQNLAQSINYCTPCTVAFVMPIIKLSFHKTCLNMSLRFFHLYCRILFHQNQAQAWSDDSGQTCCCASGALAFTFSLVGWADLLLFILSSSTSLCASNCKHVDLF